MESSSEAARIVADLLDGVRLGGVFGASVRLVAPTGDAVVISVTKSTGSWRAAAKPSQIRVFVRQTSADGEIVSDTSRLETQKRLRSAISTYLATGFVEQPFDDSTALAADAK